MDRSCPSSRLIVELPLRHPLAHAIATTSFCVWTLGVIATVASWGVSADVHPAWILLILPSVALAELSIHFYEPRFALNEDYLQRRFCPLPERSGRRDEAPDVIRRRVSRRRRSLPSFHGNPGPA